VSTQVTNAGALSSDTLALTYLRNTASVGTTVTVMGIAAYVAPLLNRTRLEGAGCAMVALQAYPICETAFKYMNSPSSKQKDTTTSQTSKKTTEKSGLMNVVGMVCKAAIAIMICGAAYTLATTNLEESVPTDTY